MKRSMGIILCGAAILIAGSLQCRAQGFIYDQQSTNAPSILGDFLDIQTDPLTQSFIPTLSSIGFVQFEFWDIPNNGNSGATVYVNLWTGSPNVNSATLIGSTLPVYMPNGFGAGFNPGVTNFDFLSQITLTAGQTYYLQPVVQTGDDPWDIWAPANTYPNGTLYDSGLAFGVDIWFREGIFATPEPSGLSLTCFGSFFAFVLKRCSNHKSG